MPPTLLHLFTLFMFMLLSSLIELMQLRHTTTECNELVDGLEVDVNLLAWVQILLPLLMGNLKIRVYLKCDHFSITYKFPLLSMVCLLYYVFSVNFSLSFSFLSLFNSQLSLSRVASLFFFRILFNVSHQSIDIIVFLFFCSIIVHVFLSGFN